MERRQRSRLATAASGAIAGGIVSITVQPLDVIRTRMQGDGAQGLIRGTWPTIQRVYRENGVLGFWRGTGPTVLRMMVGAGLHFTCLEIFKSLLHSSGEKGAHWGRDASIGGLSRGAVTILLCPITVIKTRMEYRHRPYRSTIHAATTITRTEGISGLFKGAVPTFLSNAPFSALHYMFYRKMQTTLYGESEERTAAKNFVCSTVAAALATVITQPADVVRTQIQLGYGSTGALSSVHTLRKAFSTQGVRGITLGVAPRMVKRTLQTGMIWMLYEEIAPRMQQLMDQQRAWVLDKTSSSVS